MLNAVPGSKARPPTSIHTPAQVFVICLHATRVGLARTVRIRRILLHFHCNPCSKCHIYTVYEWFWPTLDKDYDISMHNLLYKDSRASLPCGCHPVHAQTCQTFHPPGLKPEAFGDIDKGDSGTDRALVKLAACVACWAASMRILPELVVTGMKGIEACTRSLVPLPGLRELLWRFGQLPRGLVDNWPRTKLLGRRLGNMRLPLPVQVPV